MTRIRRNDHTVFVNIGINSTHQSAAVDLARILAEVMILFRCNHVGTPSMTDTGYTFQQGVVHALFVFQATVPMTRWFASQQVSVLHMHDPLHEGKEDMPFVLWPDRAGHESCWSVAHIEASLSITRSVTSIIKYPRNANPIMYSRLCG